MSEPNGAPQPETKRVRQRSPSFPFLDLETALQKAKVLYDKDKKAVIPRDAAIRNWGFSTKSSYAQQTVAALKTYGLIELVGGGLKLTSDALLMLLSEPDSGDRQAAVRKAALAPPLFASMWKTYGADMPSDSSMVTALVLLHGFPNEDSAKEFLGKYKATVRYAKLAESGSISATEADPEEGEADTEGEMQDREIFQPPPPPANAPGAKGDTGKRTSLPEGEGSLLFQIPFRGSMMTIRISAGQKLTKSLVARVRAYLELVEADLDDE